MIEIKLNKPLPNNVVPIELYVGTWYIFYNLDNRNVKIESITKIKYWIQKRYDYWW